jgi:hypothetical protein
VTGEKIERAIATALVNATAGAVLVAVCALILAVAL